MAVSRREEVAEDSARIGIRHDELAVQVVADERSDHDVEGAAPVQALQGRTEASRQLLHSRLLGLRLSPGVALAMVRF
jgi:hypothetical protein